MSLLTILNRWTYLYSGYNGQGLNRASTGTGQSTTDGYFNTITSQGQFTDIDYDRRMDVASSRIRAMVVNYLERPTSANYLLSSAKTKIANALTFYGNALKSNPDNWFYEVVAGPNNILVALIKLRTGNSFGFSDVELANWCVGGAPLFFSEQPGGRRDSDGANTIMFLSISIRKCLFENNSIEFESNVTRLKDFLRFMFVTEHGLKSDYSFHHHIGLMYLVGSYGMEFFAEFSEIFYTLETTAWQFTNNEKQVVIDTMYKGLLYAQHNGTYDFVFKHKEWYKEFTITPSFTFILNLTDLGYNLPSISQFNSYITGASMPNSIHNFYTSNIMVNKRNGWHQRVNYATNRQLRWSESFEDDRGVWGMYLGSTSTMITGSELIDLLPLCEPNRLPGGTLRQFPLLQTPFIQAAPSGIDINHISHGGGCDTDDYALVIYNSDWFDVKAKKFYFMTPVGMFCMGCDLNSIETSYNHPVATAIEQKKVSGTATMSRNGVESNITTEVNHNNINWIWQGNVGYITPISQNIRSSNITVSGRINRLLPNQTENNDLKTANVFSMWIDHGVGLNNATYQYAVIPGITLSNFRNFINPFHVISNNSVVQAVRYLNNTFAVSFQTKGFVKLEQWITISVAGPGLYILEFNNDRSVLKISVTDPYGNPSMKFEISKKYIGSPFIKYSNNASTLLEFEAGSGEFMGKTIEFNLYTEENILQNSYNIIRFDRNFEVGSLTDPTFDDIPLELSGFDNSLQASSLYNVRIYNISTNNTVPAFLTGWINNNPSVSYSTTFGDLNTINAKYSSGNINYTLTVTPNHLSTLNTVPVTGLIWRSLEGLFTISYPAPDFSRNPANGYFRSGTAGMRSLFDIDGYWGTVLNSGQETKPVILIPNGGKINITFPFAISMWVRLPDGAPETGPRLFATHHYNNDGGLGIQLRTISSTDRRIYFVLNTNIANSTLRRITSSTSLTASWQHVYADYNGTTMRIIMNNGTPVTKTGVDVANIATSPHTTPSLGGEWATDAQRMYGGGAFFSYVKIYQGTIPNDTQRTAIYNEGLEKLNLI